MNKRFTLAHKPPALLAFFWVLMLLFAAEVSAEIVAGSVADNAHSIGGGVSVGTNLEKDADFRGWTINYGTGLASGWNCTDVLLTSQRWVGADFR